MFRDSDYFLIQEKRPYDETHLLSTETVITQSDAFRRIAQEGRVGPLSVAAAPAGDLGVDFVVELEWKGVRERFGVEYRAGTSPRELEAAIVRAQQAAGGGLRPMVVTPYLGPRQLGRLIETETSGIDLSGNAVVIVPPNWFVYLSGAPNRFPASAPIKAAYAGTSSLVGRVFLLRGEYARVRDVRQAILDRGGDISLATVSKVLKRMEDDLLITREVGVRLLQPDALLERLEGGYSPPEPTLRVRARGEVTPGLLETLASASRSHGWRVAGRAETPYVGGPPPTVLPIYTSSVAALLDVGGLEAVDRFANVELVETDDQRVYFDRREIEGFYWVSPVQAYLELASGGKREQEIAATLRAAILRGT